MVKENQFLCQFYKEIHHSKIEKSGNQHKIYSSFILFKLILLLKVDYLVSRSKLLQFLSDTLLPLL